MADTVKLTTVDIDNILDEIEENEKKAQPLSSSPTTTNVNWHEIVVQLRSSNIGFVKSLIVSKEININSQNPSNGKTLLIYSVIIGNYDLVKVLCNFGADANIKDNDSFDALDYAVKCGIFRITSLIYYRQLSGRLGNDLKVISEEIYIKNKEAQNIMDFDRKNIIDHCQQQMTSWSNEYDSRKAQNSRLMVHITQFVINAIKKRQTFDSDLLYFAWYNLIHYQLPDMTQLRAKRNATEMCKDNGISSSSSLKINPLKSTLWQTMMATFEAILRDTSDRNGWKWLKEQFINSLIWYFPHPDVDAMDNKEDEDDVTEEMERILKKSLFWELLVRVRKRSKEQSIQLLKRKIDKMVDDNEDDWKQLTSYNIHSKHSANARQDSCECIIPKYNKIDLSSKKYPPSTHFSAMKHYDTNIYLNELIFRANIIDTLFQNDVRYIAKEISLETGFNIGFRAGPVKTLQRSQSKIENDYISADYPTSAKILDLNRCALQFETMKEMILGINILTHKIKNGKARCIVDIIRCKNGWSIYNVNQPQYSDIKLNVLIESAHIGSIVAELQLLLGVMSEYKKHAHKLYSVSRKYEFMYTYGQLQEEMSTFIDIGSIDGAMVRLAQMDDIDFYKLVFEVINNNDYVGLLSKKTLTDDDGLRDLMKYNAVFHVLIHKNGKIHKYLKDNFGEQYMNAILKITQIVQRKGYKDSSGWNTEDKSFEWTTNFTDIYPFIVHDIKGDLHKDETLSLCMQRIFDILTDKTKALSLLTNKKQGIIDDQTRNGYTPFMEICRDESMYIKTVETILNHLDVKDEKCEAFMLDKKDESEDTALFWAFKPQGSRRDGVALKIIDFIKNDKELLLTFLSGKSNYLLKQFSVVAFRSLFYESALNKEEIRELLVKFGGRWTTILHIKSPEAFMEVFGYLAKNHSTDLIEIIARLKGRLTILHELANVDVALKCLQYLKKHDPHLLRKWINSKAFRGDLWETFPSEKKNHPFQEFMLECGVVNDRQLVRDFMSKDIKSKWILFSNLRLRYIVCDFVKHDRKKLLKALTLPQVTIYDDGESSRKEEQTIFTQTFKNWETGSFAKKGDNETATKIIKLVMESKALTDDDKWNLLLNESTSGLDCLLTFIHQIATVTHPRLRMIMDFCKKNAQRLTKMVLRKGGIKNKSYVDCIYDSNEHILALLQDVKHEKYILRIIEYMTKDKEEEWVNIDSVFVIHTNDLIRSWAMYSKLMRGTLQLRYVNLQSMVHGAVILGKKEMFDMLLSDFICGDKEKWMKVCTPKCVVKVLKGIKFLDMESNINSLKYLILDNSLLSLEDKYTLVYEGACSRWGNVPIVQNQSVLFELVRYFKDNKKYLSDMLTLAFAEFTFVHYEKTAQYSRCFVKYLLNDISLYDINEKMDLFIEYSIKQTWENDANDKTIVSLITSEMINYCVKNGDKMALQKWFNHEFKIYETTKALIEICRSENKETSKSLALFFSDDNGLLNMDDKFILLSDYDFKGLHCVFNLNDEHCLEENVKTIFNYFRNDDDKIIKMITHKSSKDGLNCLSSLIRRDGTDASIVFILEFINSMSYSSQIKLLSDIDEKNEEHFLFGIFAWFDNKKKDEIFKQQRMIEILKTIKNDKVLEYLLNQKDKNNNTILDIAKEKNEEKLMHLIEHALDYIKIVKEKDMETINVLPFISSAIIGKKDIIFELLKNVKTSDYLQSCLINEFDPVSGDYLNAILLKTAKHYQLFYDILQFMVDNQYNELLINLLTQKVNHFTNSDKTILMLLCQDEESIDIFVKIFDHILNKMDKTTKFNILNKTDSVNDTCFHMAKGNILKYLRTFA